MDGVKRTIELVLTAKDQASGTVARSAQKIRQSLKDAEGPINGPANRTTRVAGRSPEEQRLRDMEAGRERARRDAARRATDNAEVERRIRERENRRMGESAGVGPTDTGLVHGPAVKDRHSEEEKQLRAGEAERLRDLREAEQLAARNAEIERRIRQRENARLSQQAAAGGTDTGLVHGPANRRPRTSQRSAEEQAIRDAEAAQLRENREQARRAQQNAEVERRIREREHGRLGRSDVQLGRDDPQWREERARQARELRAERQTLANAKRERDSLAKAESANGLSEATRKRFNLDGATGGGVAGGGGRGAGGRASGFQLEDKVNLGIGKFAGEGAAVIGLMAAVGRALQNLPQAIEEYKAALKTGATPLQAAGEALGKNLAGSVPIAGDLGKGIRSLADVVFDNVDTRKGGTADLLSKLLPKGSGLGLLFGGDEVALAEKRKQQDARDAKSAADAERAEAERQRRERMEGIAGRLDSTTRTAANKQTLEGIADPFARERKQAEIDLKARQAEIDKVIEEAKQKGGDLAPVMAAAARARAQADSQYNTAISAANDKEAADTAKRREQEERLQRDHQARMADAAGEARVRELEAKGDFLAASLAQIENANAAELRAIEDARTERVNQILQEGKDVERLTAQANQRANEATAAANAKAKAQRDAAAKQEEDDRKKRERGHARQMDASRENLAEGALRLAGRDEEAEKLRRAFDHQQEIKDIQETADEEAKRNAKEADTIRRNAAERVAAKNAEFALNEKLREQQEQQAKAEQFKVRDGGLDTGDNRLLTGTLARGLREDLAVEARSTAADDANKQAVAQLEELKKNTTNSSQTNTLLTQLITWMKQNPPSAGRAMSN